MNKQEQLEKFTKDLTEIEKKLKVLRNADTESYRNLFEMYRMLVNRHSDIIYKRVRDGEDIFYSACEEFYNERKSFISDELYAMGLRTDELLKSENYKDYKRLIQVFDKVTYFQDDLLVIMNKIKECYEDNKIFNFRNKSSIIDKDILFNSIKEQQFTVRSLMEIEDKNVLCIDIDRNSKYSIMNIYHSKKTSRIDYIKTGHFDQIKSLYKEIKHICNNEAITNICLNSLGVGAMLEDLIINDEELKEKLITDIRCYPLKISESIIKIKHDFEEGNVEIVNFNRGKRIHGINVEILLFFNEIQNLCIKLHKKDLSGREDIKIGRITEEYDKLTFDNLVNYYCALK